MGDSQALACQDGGMPWRKTEPVMERARFIALHLEGLYSMSELCWTLAKSGGVVGHLLKCGE
jgi:hypothetical protein